MKYFVLAFSLLAFASCTNCCKEDTSAPKTTKQSEEDAKKAAILIEASKNPPAPAPKTKKLK